MIDSYKIYNDDCRNVLRGIPANSIDFIATDPPYFIYGLGDDWNDENISNSNKSNVIKSLPEHMFFDRQQGYDLYDFMYPIAKEYYRILKPGAFCCVFSQARLYHHMAMALDNNNFEIRDMMGWKYEGQAKAFSLNHFINKQNDLSQTQKENLIKELSGWKTPQLKPQIEPIVLAQKPKEGTFIDNWIKYGVGLLNTNQKFDDMFPGNIIEIAKSERNKDTDFKIEHITVKPVKLIEHLIKLFTQENQVVLDSFCGSGSHCIAALNTNRKFIGIEREKKYCEIIMKRIEKLNEIKSNDIDSFI